MSNVVKMKLLFQPLGETNVVQSINFIKTVSSFWALAIFLMLPCLSLAADIVVNTALDEYNPGNGECSLREAIINANSDSDTSVNDCAAGSGADYISFLADYTITLDGSQLPAISSEMTISGNGAANTIIEASATPNTVNYGVFEIGSGNLTLNGLTVRNGVYPGTGYGGGGIINDGTLTITDSLITANTSSGTGGGIFNGGTLDIIRSTIANNAAGGAGGGIATIGPSLTLANCTVSGNVAVGGGGGIYQGNEGGTPLVQLINTTVTGNSYVPSGHPPSDPGGHGLYLSVAGATFSNSIIANNGEQNCETYDAAAMPVSLGYNIDSGNTCGLDATGDQVNTDPLLGPLADNGGPTQTVALQPGSPAIHAGSDTVCTSTPVNGIDQRGISRPFGDHCDIGAYEYEGQLGEIFVVNTAGDLDDGVCTADDCSLREAINAANSWPGMNSITFLDDYTITLNGSQLPDITTEMAISGNGTANTIIQASETPDTATHRVFEVGFGGSLTLNNLTVQNGGGGTGAGIDNSGGTLALTNVNVLNNHATGYGGGIFAGGPTTLSGSLIKSNVANIDGGGFHCATSSTCAISQSTISLNEGRYGGGIHNYGNITLTESTVSSNGASRDGGGIYNWGTLTLQRSTIANNVSTDDGAGLANLDSATMVNCTVTGNIAQGSEHGLGGGGIYQAQDGPVPAIQLVNTTVAANSHNSADGDGLYIDSGSVTFSNSIISDNGGQNCSGSGSFSSLGYNLDSDNTCSLNATGDRINTDPLLGPLADNGGPTQTMALMKGSPAINTANETVCANAPVSGVDQRGEQRLDGGGCDMGAYETSYAFPWTMFLPAITGIN